MKQIPLNSVDYYTTFADFLSGISHKYSAKPAISYFTRRKEERCYTYGELTAQVFALRAALTARGLAGKHIALVGENSYRWILTYLAVAASGGVVVCIDIEQPVDAIREMILAADAAAIFASSSCLSICAPLVGEDSSVRLLAALEDEPSEPNVAGFAALCEEGRALLDEKGDPCQGLRINPTQTAAIVYTSGTTSTSKPVMLSQQGILHNASDAMAYVSLGGRVFTSLPFYHTYGMTCSVLTGLIVGAHVFINGDLKTVMRDLHLSNPVTMMSVPLLIEAIHNQIWLSAEKEGKAAGLQKLFKIQRIASKLHLSWRSKVLDDIRKKAVGSLRIMISGGAHLSPDIEEEFELLGILVLQGYGITECAPLISVNRNELHKTGTVGMALHGCAAKTVDGEIWFKGINVMNGYYKSPELTAEVMEDGWFKTGDLGSIDKDGFITITGRKKSLIVFKNGKKISPEKLEEQLRKIPLVKDVLVYGAPTGVSADDVKLSASIYPDPERAAGLSSYEILEHLQQEVNKINSDLPLYQQVQMIHIREQEFSKTASKKIKRNQVPQEEGENIYA
ncbi:MAG: AMP-binding protein [Oscillospiraceae bacterium]|jgi:long-chain acyl-CoA synthetase